MGYDPAVSPDRKEVTTGSGVEFVALLQVMKMVALGRERNQFPVLAHTLPPSAGVDGVLGLDFLRRSIVTVDVQRGRVDLAEASDEPERNRPGE